MEGVPTKTREALEALWRKHAGGWRRLLSRGMLTELSLRSSFDVGLLSARRIRNRVPKGTIPDCQRCEDICCAGAANVVSLRLVDIATLIDVDRTDLIVQTKPRFPERMVEGRPALFELHGSELFRTLPVLRQIGEHRICAALSSDLECSLHPNWPLSCERFPYTLDTGRRRVHWGTRCPEQQRDPAHTARGKEMFHAAVRTFNERVRDAVLLAHARETLDEIGIGAFLSHPGDDPFEPLS